MLVLIEGSDQEGSRRAWHLQNGDGASENAAEKLNVL